MKLFKYLLSLILCLSLVGVGQATIYYVDNTVTDTNVGSATCDFTTYNPTTFSTSTGSNCVYKTIADVNAKSPSAGDSVLFRKGQTWREQLTVPAAGSSGAENTITYGAYGTGEKPIISGANVGTPTTPVRQYCILSQKSYVTIDGFELDYPTVANISVGESTTLTTYNTIQNLTVKHAPNSGWKAGIVLNHASNNLITYNIITDCYVGIMLSSYHASLSWPTDSNTVSHNTVAQIDEAGISLASGSATSYQLKDNIVEYNDVSLCAQTFDDSNGIGTSRSGGGNIIRYNKSYNNGLDPVTMRGSGIMIDENSNGEQVYYNIVYGNTSSGIGTSGDTTLIYNNTLYNNSVGIALFYSGITHDSSANSLIKNNIILANGDQGYITVRAEAVASGGNVFDYNIYYGSSKGSPFSWDTGGPPAYDHTWAQWQVHNPETHSYIADPLFVSTSDFHLKPSSPAINAGVGVGLTTDYEGRMVPIGSATDIGAYEWSGLNSIMFAM